MSSDLILTIILGLAAVVISLTAFVGGIKEGKESFRKLNDHLDAKEKEAKEKDYQSQGVHQY